MTHSFMYVWHDSPILSRTHSCTCDMTHSFMYVWHDSLIHVCVTWLTHSCTCDMTLSLYTCDMTHLYIRDMTDPECNGKDALAFAPGGSYICEMTPSCSTRLIHIRATWLIQRVTATIHTRCTRFCSRWVICDMTPSFLTRLIRIHVTWLIQRVMATIHTTSSRYLSL